MTPASAYTFQDRREGGEVVGDCRQNQEYFLTIFDGRILYRWRDVRLYPLDKYGQKLEIV